MRVVKRDGLLDMTKLQCRVPPDLAEIFRRKAAQAGMSPSRYLAELVKRDVCASDGWPEAYFDIFGRWQGAELERPPQGDPEVREPLE